MVKVTNVGYNGGRIVNGSNDGPTVESTGP